jgi:hypothetical protein
MLKINLKNKQKNIILLYFKKHHLTRSQTINVHFFNERTPLVYTVSKSFLNIRGHANF